MEKSRVEESKSCTACGVVKGVDSFYVDKRYENRRTAACVDCHRRAAKERYARDIESSRAKHRAKRASDPEGHAEYQRLWKLKNSYGIDGEDYDRMLAEQGGVCAICGRKPGKRALSVDHCHATGRVRGLLCHGCNTSLGHMEDNPDTLNRAIQYLQAVKAD